MRKHVFDQIRHKMGNTVLSMLEKKKNNNKKQTNKKHTQKKQALFTLSTSTLFPVCIKRVW